MSIKDDILALEAQQETVFTRDGKYQQALPTPPEVPLQDSRTSITELRRPSDDLRTPLSFSPTAADYQFRVDTWEQRVSSKGQKLESVQGYTIVATRDLGDGTIETVTKKVGEEVLFSKLGTVRE